MNWNKFIMMKKANPLINKDEMLDTNEFING
jgi:hypothetical protein